MLLNNAKVPEAERSFKTKEAIAYEMVLHARRLKLLYSWIGADGGYGKGLDFPLKLEDLGETFVIDVHKDQLIYLERPQLEVPAYSGRGRKPEKSRPTQKPLRADNFALAQPEDAWQKIPVHEGAKGMVEYEFSWYHHIALVMMALLFMMMEKIENRDETPLLTGRDISELLTFYLQKPPTEEEVFRRIEIRHKKRRRDMKNAAKRKRKSSG